MRVIADPVEARRLIDRFLVRAERRDAYGELLASGQVSRRISDSEDREAWRRDLRRQARADKLKIITRECDDFVIALLTRPPTAERDVEGRDTLRAGFEAADVARGLGHQSRVASREHEESVAYCTVCNAIGHADGTGADLVLAGALYTDPCGA